MDDLHENLDELFDPRNTGFVGFGYKEIKSSAELAAQRYGCEWAKKFPSTKEARQLKGRIRRIVYLKTPVGHSNKYVVWQRYRQYALEFSGE